MIKVAWLGLSIVLLLGMLNMPAHAYCYVHVYVNGQQYNDPPNTHDHGGDEYCWTWVKNQHVYVCGQGYR
jgi:hypothetical protein